MSPLVSFSRHRSVAFFLVVGSLFISAEVLAKSKAPGESELNCPTLLQAVSEADKDPHWSPGTNLFSETLPATLVSTVAWMSIVESVRQIGLSSDPSITPTFLRTVPIDATLSAISHGIALGQFPVLAKLLSGSGLSPKVEFWARTGTNAILNSALIAAGWAISGIDVGGAQVAGAFTLCAGVYPVLQKLKTVLFKVFPFGRDCEYQACLVNEMREQVAPVLDAARTRAQELHISSEQTEALLISSLEAVLTSRPYESDAVRIPALVKVPKIKKLIDQISVPQAALESTESPYTRARLQRKIMRLRRQLLDEILKVSENLRGQPEAQEIVSLLDLGAPFNSETSIQFHRVFSERFATYRKRLMIASFLDQAVAVGIAGGIFLYNTTYWAQHGQWPGLLPQ